MWTNIEIEAYSIADNITDQKTQVEKIKEKSHEEQEVEIGVIEEKKDVKEEIVKEERNLEYITKYIESNELAKSEIKVIQQGQVGVEETVFKKTFENGIEVDIKETRTHVTKAKLDKIIAIGTNSSIGKTNIKLGEKFIVFANRLEMHFEPNSETKKVTTLNKNEEVTVIGTGNKWCKVVFGNLKGYVQVDGLITKQKVKEEFVPKKNTVINNLNFTTNLAKPSGFTLQQFEKALTDLKDVNSVFKNNAKYFYYIEEQYNINGMFVAAVAIHESAWGTSQISRDKKNLFGYGAYDSNPYDGAYDFNNYSEGIDLLARVFVKYYLTPKGTKIYEDEIAVGTYYTQPTISGVNRKYATDTNWKNCVYEYMQDLYSKGI